ncbi:putative RNA-directed DNA polymerase [Helianthus annuus]|nr:putative RNA-directed DNA polymerase [Helianthus annuus]KAJ0939486.1 putative RNA-directed DNA polymerase [Helianthus annuus]
MQETMYADGSRINFKKFWGNYPLDTDWVNSEGRSGGLACLWDPTIFTRSNTFKHRNYLLICGTIRGISDQLHIMNVYAPQSASSKRALWSHIIDLKASQGGIWIILGDFNQVRSAEEKRNCIFDPVSAADFNSFIYEANLAEYLMNGSKFTRWLDGGNKMSKLDRMLVCDKFWGLWPTASLRTLPRNLSDHCPLVLITTSNDFGSIPFKFFNAWLSKPGLDTAVRSAVSTFSLYGPPDVVLAEKLRCIKKAVKEWNKKTKKEENASLSTSAEVIKKLDLLCEIRDLSEVEKSEYMEHKNIINLINDGRVNELQQKSRVRWAIEGDENSAFFHGYINSRISRSRLNGLFINGDWCTDPTLIKEEIRKFFENKFVEPNPSRPAFTCHHIKKLTNMQSMSLISPFSFNEVKNAVWDCGGDKAPGPDGFNFTFLKHYWDLLGDDFHNILIRFHNSGIISKGCSSSFITLIPKINDPENLNDFRPINLIGCISKVISKVLANRLKMVIASVISEEQSAYLSDRNILDGPLITNEIISWIKKSKKRAFLFKIDFEKAFDTISWSFIKSVFMQMNFPDKWIQWIHGILVSSRSSVLVNGSPTEEFQCFRGVRQGDPLSPFIFILAMEALSSFMISATSAGIIKGISLPNNGPKVSHLIFADDVMLLGAWEEDNFVNIRRFMRCFFLVSGLKINFHKSCLYGVGTASSECDYMASRLGCNSGSIPFMYLGLKVGGNMNKFNNWSPVIETFEARLSLWKASTLSIGGRTTLIKSVLDSLPLYYFSLYQAPMAVLNKLEKIRRDFLWGDTLARKRMHWVRWDRVTQPIKSGGLGLDSLYNMNCGLLSKWAWRYKTESNRLWRSVIMSLHFNRKQGNFLPSKKGLSGVWNNITKREEALKNKDIHLNLLFRCKIGNGSDTQFWTDVWAVDIPLKVRFPLLYSLEKHKGCCVRDRLQKVPGENTNRITWGWLRYPSSLQELAELEALTNIVMQSSLSESKDVWSWASDPTGAFSVKSVKKLLNNSYNQPMVNNFEWNSWVPRKVNIFGWRTAIDRLPTRAALARRNISMASTCCPLCGEGEETIQHLLTECMVSSVTWQMVSGWIGIPPIYAFTTEDLFRVHKNLSGPPKMKKLVQAIIIISCWNIWKLRNNVIFSGNRVDVSRLLAEIKSTSFLWVRNRAKMQSLEWSDWCSFNVL